MRLAFCYLKASLSTFHRLQIYAKIGKPADICCHADEAAVAAVDMHTASPMPPRNAVPDARAGRQGVALAACIIKQNKYRPRLYQKSKMSIISKIAMF